MDPVKPSAIYVWLVPSEEMLDQPGSWRIRKWDTAPFPEANFTLSAGATCDRNAVIEECARVCDRACIESVELLNRAPNDYVRACANEAESLALAIRQLAVSPQTGVAHTDHPLRHWDRTCPACIAESTQTKPGPFEGSFGDVVGAKATVKDWGKVPSSNEPSIDPWPDLERAKQDFTFGQLWVLGSQYADLYEARLSAIATAKTAHPEK